MTSSGGDGAERRYNDAEVRLLLERASRLQGGTAPVRHQGFTLGQLEEIAAEAQIDVSRLRQAARELDSGAIRPAGTLERLAGAPFRIHVERTLPFEVGTNELSTLVARIDALSGDSGSASLVGRTFTWIYKAASGRNMQVRVTVERGRTQVWVGERYGEVAGGVFGGVMGGVGSGAGIGGGIGVASALGMPMLAAVLPAAIFGGVYAACRVGYTKYVRNRARSIEELCDRIAGDLSSLHAAARELPHDIDS